MKDTGVCLSMPVRFSILVMYSYSYSDAPPTVVVVTPLALSSLVSRAMSLCVASCLYVWLELLDNCELRFELLAFNTYNVPTKMKITMHFLNTNINTHSYKITDNIYTKFISQ